MAPGSYPPWPGSIMTSGARERGLPGGVKAAICIWLDARGAASRTEGLAAAAVEAVAISGDAGAAVSIVVDAGGTMASAVTSSFEAGVAATYWEMRGLRSGLGSRARAAIR